METLHPTGIGIRGPWVEVDLARLKKNIASMQGALQPGSSVMFILKANAYGHGIQPVARASAESGVNWFGVAYVEEALELREAAPDASILVMGVTDPAHVPVLLEKRITPIVVSEEHGAALASAAQRAGTSLEVHLKVDTGMSRLGVYWEDAVTLLNRLEAMAGLNVTGICSHFATVEPQEPEAALEQYRRFDSVLHAFPKKLFRHLSSSRAFLYHKEWDFDAIRAGISLYGYGTGEEGMRARTEPILQWKTTVMQVKAVPAHTPVGYYGTYTTPSATHLATLAVGYADGYLRTLSNRADVLIRGKRRRVVGRVSMNWITVDVGPDSDVRPGDEVVLLGEQGDEVIWADELARRCRTIPYEILTMINPQLERKYLSG